MGGIRHCLSPLPYAVTHGTPSRDAVIVNAASSSAQGSEALRESHPSLDDVRHQLHQTALGPASTVEGAADLHRAAHGCRRTGLPADGLADRWTGGSDLRVDRPPGDPDLCTLLTQDGCGARRRGADRSAGGNRGLDMGGLDMVVPGRGDCTVADPCRHSAAGRTGPGNPDQRDADPRGRWSGNRR